MILQFDILTFDGMEMANYDSSTEIVEEDWSSFMDNLAINAGKDDNTTSPETISGYASHEEVKIPLSQRPSIYIELKCVESLTPLDMIHLSFGRCDPTGNRIWMGALLFLELFVRPLPKHDDVNDIISKLTTDGDCSYVMNLAFLIHWRKLLFHEKDVLELGTGTGAAGIGLAVMGGRETILNQDDKMLVQPSLLTLTDSDPNVLELCKKNCKANLNSTDCYIQQESRKESTSSEHVLSNHTFYEVRKLIWGQKNNFGPEEESSQMKRKRYDTVFATDVLYDLSSLHPLMITASSMLKPRGYFLLSHVPRASLTRDDGTCYIGSDSQLEPLISEEAKINELTLLFCIRPKDLSHIWGSGKMMTSAQLDFDEMGTVGASMLVFQKNTCHRIPEKDY